MGQRRRIPAVSLVDEAGTAPLRKHAGRKGKSVAALGTQVRSELVHLSRSSEDVSPALHQVLFFHSFFSFK